MLKATQETYPRCVCDLITIADTLVVPEERETELLESCLCEECVLYTVRVEGDVHADVAAPDCVSILFGPTAQAHAWCKLRFLTAVRFRNTLRRLLRSVDGAVLKRIFGASQCDAPTPSTAEKRLPIGKTLNMPAVRGTVVLTRTA